MANCTPVLEQHGKIGWEEHEDFFSPGTDSSHCDLRTLILQCLRRCTVRGVHVLAPHFPSEMLKEKCTNDSDSTE